jgi:ribose transport system substrate-binding protein
MGTGGSWSSLFSFDPRASVLDALWPDCGPAQSEQLRRLADVDRPVPKVPAVRAKVPSRQQPAMSSEVTSSPTSGMTILSPSFASSLAASAAAANKQPVIGVVVYDMSGFETTSKPGMEAEAKALGDKLLWDSANLSCSQEVVDLRTFITEHVSAIIVDPVNASCGDSIIPQAKRAGIPVIATNTALFKAGSQPKPGSYAATVGNEPGIASYEGPNDYGAGVAEMEALAKKLHGKGNIVELQGPLGQTPSTNRTAGIAAVLKKYPHIHLLAAQTANWDRSQAYTVMAGFWSSFGTKINGVVSENDDMAIGANRVLALHHEEYKIPVVGLDGIQNGMQAVASGAEIESNLQDGMVEQGEAVWVANQIIHHKPYPKYVVYNMIPLTKANVHRYYNQMYVHLGAFRKQLPQIIAHDMKTHKYSAQ